MRVVQVLRETGKADVNVKNKVRLFLLRLYFLCILDTHVARALTAVSTSLV